MNFVKRGLISIKRKLAKSIILIIIIFVLGNIIAGAVSIKQAVKNTETSMRKSIGAVASLQLDYMKLEKEQNLENFKIEYVSADTINKIGASSYVKYYDYSEGTSLKSTTLKRYTNQENMNENSLGYEYIYLTGVQYAEVLDFKEQKAKLTEGRTFTEEEIKSGKNVIIISTKLAEQNGLSLGSTITLRNDVVKPMSSDEMQSYAMSSIAMEYKEEIIATQDLEFEIIGIFETKQEAPKQTDGMIDFKYIDEEKQNKIYTPNQAIRKINDFIVVEIGKYDEEQAKNYGQAYYTPIFILNNPLEVEDFRKEVEPLLPEYYIVIDNSEGFKQIAAPMTNMEWIAQIVLYVAIGATVIILSLLITLFLRDRKHEVGIYLALGEKKKRVIAQIVLEVVAVAFIGITLSLFSGNVLASLMSKTMLRNQIVAKEEESMTGGVISYSYSSSTFEWLGYGANVSTDDLIENYSVSLDLSTVLLIYAIGIGTIFVSTVVPIIYIVRLNPKKIMM